MNKIKLRSEETKGQGYRVKDRKDQGTNSRTKGKGENNIHGRYWNSQHTEQIQYSYYGFKSQLGICIENFSTISLEIDATDFDDRAIEEASERSYSPYRG